MPVPCVRVEREDGEATRQRLAQQGLLDRDHEITSADGALYIPVSDPDAVPSEYTVIAHDPPRRETQTTPADRLDFDPSYERLGEVVIIDEDDPDRARALADALCESAIPTKTVLNRASKIRGTERVRDWEILVGEETAKRMIYLGQRLDAETAEDEGLFGEVVPDEEIDDRAAELAAEIATKPAFALRAAKQAIAQGYSDPAGLDYEKRTFAGLFGTPDQREGMTAFVEDREADFE
jgi:hypothetical protein